MKLLNKDSVLSLRMNAINESVFKHGDIFKVKTTVDIPKSLINAFVSKAKKEHDTDPRENWSDVDLAEMFVNYICANFVNIETLPVDAILGEPQKTPGEISTEVQPTEVELSVQPSTQPSAQAQAQPQPNVQAQAQTKTQVQAQPTDNELPSGQIEN